ncbi:MAG: hypothetical protein ABIB79_00120 [archaeon]
MVKKRGLTITIIMVLIIAGLNAFLFFKKDSGSISGMAFQNISQSLGVNISLIAFIGQWVILLLIVFITYMRFLKHKKEEESKCVYHITTQKKSRSQTDLDVLYNLLKDKKSVSTATISKIFKITKDQALEWAKILENHELAVIEYPAFDDPEVRIYEKEVEEKTEEEEQKPSQQKELKQEAKEKPKTKENSDNKKGAQPASRTSDVKKGIAASKSNKPAN